MSKFLKLIVHFFVICTIVCVLGLAVPPFFGVTTEIIDNSGKETNLPMGSVTYAIPVKAEEATIGDSILYQNGSKAYKYTITEMDQKTGIFKVADSTAQNSEIISVQVKEYIPKVVMTIGFVGYLMAATESIEGLIILGLAVLFIVILYIIAELWKKDPQDEYEEDDPEPGYVKSKKELKMEEKARQRRYKEEEREIKSENKQRKKGKKQERKKIRTGGFVDEIYEDDLEPEEDEHPVAVQAATSEAHELLKKEIAAATAEEIPEQEKPEFTAQKTEVVVPLVKEEFESAKDEIPQEEEKTVEIGKMAIPVWSAAQIADSARKQGDAPDIIRDNVTKVTLFDYSDIVADEQKLPEEENE